MKKFIVEYVQAYKIEAENAEQAAEKLDDAFCSGNMGQIEQWHENAGYWAEIMEPYAAEEE